MNESSLYNEKFDMSVRMWSDDISIKSILESLGVSIDHSNEKGENIKNDSQKSRRVAPRNYVSIMQARGYDAKDISIWLDKVKTFIESEKTLIKDVVQRHIEVIVWIAIFGRSFVDIPNISQEVINDMGRCGVKIFIENYTDFDEAGNPKKNWLI